MPNISLDDAAMYQNMKNVDPNTGLVTRSAFMRQTPRGQAEAAQAQISKLEMQLSSLQAEYSQGMARGMRPSQLAALQSQISSLQGQINNMKQRARMNLSIAALEAQQQARGRSSVGLRGQGGQPNQSDLDRSQLYQLLAGMFDSGMGAGRMW